LELFNQIEEQNLFLIQNNQEIESQYDDLKNLTNIKRGKLEDQFNEANRTTEELKSRMLQKQEKLHNIQTARKNLLNDEDDGMHEKLSIKLQEVWGHIWRDVDTQGVLPSPLTMITDIERKMDKLLHKREMIPKDERDKEEFKLEKNRRLERVNEARLREKEKNFKQ